MNIRTGREAAAISQAELARRIGMNQPKLSKIENGHIQPTQGEEALILAALSADIEFALPLANEAFQLAEEELATVLHCQSYPAAPTDTTARRAWVTQRSRNMERGFPSPESGTFGGKKKNA